MRTFDKRVLRDYLESAGFSVEQMSFDGYFFGHPFSFWMRTRFRNKIYRAFEMFLVWRYGGTAGSTLLPKWIAQFLMPPLEIIAIAKKKSEPLGC